MARNVHLKIVEKRLNDVLDDALTKTHKKNGNNLNNKIRADIKNFYRKDKDFTFLVTDECIFKEYKDKFSSKFKDLDFTDTDKKKRKNDLNLKRYFNLHYFRNEQPRCCFCGQLLIETKDNDGNKYLHADVEHIFPKKKFPQLALCIHNFAPCCSECNRGEKNDRFFENKNDFFEALDDLNIKLLHPFKLWENIKYDFANKSFKNVKNSSKGYQLLEFYGLHKRYELIAGNLYNNLFNRIKHNNIRTPEALENYLEFLSNTSIAELRDGFSLNNSPKLFQDFIDWILYDECNLIALWDELKEYRKLDILWKLVS